MQVGFARVTEQQPENNVYRILLETLAVTLSKRARARAVQLPALNEALGLPRPSDQQWSLRLQQILAYETDLLEYDDIFDGSTVIATKVAELKTAGDGRNLPGSKRWGRGAGSRIELHETAAGPVERPAARSYRTRRAQRVVGVNTFTETEPSPLASG